MESLSEIETENTDAAREDAATPVTDAPADAPAAGETPVEETPAGEEEPAPPQARVALQPRGARGEGLLSHGSLRGRRPSRRRPAGRQRQRQ